MKCSSEKYCINIHISFTLGLFICQLSPSPGYYINCFIVTVESYEISVKKEGHL